MARESIEIGSTPYDEQCAQVGSADYRRRAFIEMKAYIGQIRRLHGPEPEGARLGIRSNPHDFGTYHEVVVYYETTDVDALAYALKVEANSPARWDNVARAELLAAGLDLSDESYDNA